MWAGLNRAAQDVTATTVPLIDLVDTLTDEEIKAAEAAAKLAQNLRDQVGLNALMLGGLDKESEAFRIRAAEIEANRSLEGKLNDEHRKLIAARERQVTQLGIQETNKELQKQISLQAPLLAGLTKESEAYRIHVQEIELKANQAGILTEETRKLSGELEHQNTLLAHQDFTQGLQDQLTLQSLLLGGLNEESQEYQTQVALLEAKRSLGEDLTAEERRLVDLIKQNSREIDQRNEFAEEIKGIWEGVGASIQNTFSDAYEQIFSGGIDNFEDLASSIKDIMIKAAADIAAAYTAEALFKGLGGAAAALGAGGAAAGETGTGGGGIQSAGFTSIYGQTALTPPASGGGMFGSGVSGQAALGYGAGGALGGSMLGPAVFGKSPGATTGGAIGGGIGAIGGAIAGQILIPIPGVGAAIGATVGGIGGGLLGSGLGSLFGGGGGGPSRARIGGGALGGTGTGLAGQFGAGIDQQLQQALTTSQEAIVNAALRMSEAVTVEFNKKKGLSEGDKQRIAAARLGPAAAALGITNIGAVTAGTAEQQMGQFQEALTVKQAIEDLRASLAPFAAQWEDLNEQFAEITATAHKYGLSLDGVAEAQQLASAELARAQRQQMIAVAASVGAWDPLTVALHQLDVQMQEAAAQADLLGISTANLTENASAGCHRSGQPAAAADPRRERIHRQHEPVATSARRFAGSV